jgi:hypothetical protein
MKGLNMGTRCLAAVVLAVSLLIAAPVSAGRPARGTGANPRSSMTRGYMKKNGTYVAPSRRTAPDGKMNNNYSTKGNSNPNGKKGSK